MNKNKTKHIVEDDEKEKRVRTHTHTHALNKRRRKKKNKKDDPIRVYLASNLKFVIKYYSDIYIYTHIQIWLIISNLRRVVCVCVCVCVGKKVVKKSLIN